MNDKESQPGIKQLFRESVIGYTNLQESPVLDKERHEEQLQVLLTRFRSIYNVIESSSIFSKNELLEDISTDYLPLLSVDYYIASLHLLAAPPTKEEKETEKNLRVPALEASQQILFELLKKFSLLGSILSPMQESLLSLESKADPVEVPFFSSDPASRRSQKIENYKAEKALRQKLQILDEFQKDTFDSNALSNLDEELVRQIYTDELKLISIHIFRDLELIGSELKVLRSKDFTSTNMNDDSRVKRSHNFQPGKSKFSDLVSRQGKILRPFTIKSLRQDLHDKVYGTGQVLPSLTVEEFLDYELANGKLGAESTPATHSSEEEDDSDEEFRKRAWDDWKDDNPKGSGNMKANIG